MTPEELLLETQVSHSLNVAYEAGRKVGFIEGQLKAKEEIVAVLSMLKGVK